MSFIRKKIKQFNKLNPLVDYLVPLINKPEVKILDVGSGPYPITGQTLDGVNIEITHCDKQDFSYFWEKYDTIPVFDIEIQDMEKLTYPDESFDIVHSVNALDHTIDALSALKEMLRVCKKGGFVYIDCALIQKTNRGKKHYWDALEDGTFTNGVESFNLKDFGFKIEFVDNGGPRQYNHIICICSPS